MKRLTFPIAVMLLLVSFPRFSFGDGLDRFGPPLPVPRVEWITIIGNQEGDRLVTKIEPFTDVKIDRFTKVIFTNQSPLPIRLIFGTGKECKQVSEASLRVFDIRYTLGCWALNQPLPPGQPLEIRFNEPGQFPYTVQFVGTDNSTSGFVTVY